MITIIGAGLAGCEAAWQLTKRGHQVRLIDQKPKARTPAQTSDSLCELVCSNSMRGAAKVNAVGLLKDELRQAGSLILECADATKVPAGGALAVDREKFAALVTDRIKGNPAITFESSIVTKIPDATRENPVILATGPLTGDELAADLVSIVGSSQLAYYDAIAPIVSAESIQWDRVFRQSRWGKGATPDGENADDLDATALGDEAYVNCPFDAAEYKGFVEAVRGAVRVEPRAFEKVRYFEGCLPVEVMADRGEMTLAFGPMKPVGLTDPKTGRRPFAVVQLRQEDEAATAYNLVGFQTRMTHPEQARVLRMIPGLAEAEFLRYGAVHRNTFVNSPLLLDGGMELKARPNVFLAGQITGVEGYVESCASGFLTALLLAQSLASLVRTPPPPTTAMGGLLSHLTRVRDDFQPSNITWAHVAPLEAGRLKKRERYAMMVERAVKDMAEWRDTAPLLRVDGSGATAPLSIS